MKRKKMEMKRRDALSRGRTSQKISYGAAPWTQRKNKQQVAHWWQTLWIKSNNDNRMSQRGMEERAKQSRSHNGGICSREN